MHKTGNGVLVDKYAQKTALRLGVTPDAVRAEFRKLSRAKASVPQVNDELLEEPPKSSATTPIPGLERWLLRLLLTNDDLVPWIAGRLDSRWILDPTVRRIVEARISSFRTNSWTGVAGFLDTFDDRAIQGLVTAVVSDRRGLTDPEKVLKGDPTITDKRGILERLRDEFIVRQLALLQQRTNQPECADAERLDLLRQQEELRRLKRQPIEGGGVIKSG